MDTVGLDMALFYENAWKRLSGISEEVRSEVNEMRSREEALFAGNERLPEAKRFCFHFEMSNFLTRIVRGLAYKASKVFGSKKGELEIDYIEIDREVHAAVFYSDCFTNDYKKPNFDAFSPVAIWEKLEREYGNGKGIMEMRRRAASDLASVLGVRRGLSMQTRKGSAVVSIGKHEIVVCLRALEVFGEWTDLDWEVDLVQEWIVGREGGSRRKLEFGPHLSIRVFKSKYEISFSLGVAEQVQFFLGEFYFAEKTKEKGEGSEAGEEENLEEEGLEGEGLKGSADVEGVEVAV